MSEELRGTDDLEPDTETNLKDVLVSLLDGKKDIDLKSEINNPKDLAGLKIYGDVLNTEEMTDSSILILSFIDTYLRYMFSKDRESRKEIIRAIEGLLERESVKMTISERMTTNLKDK